MSSPPDPRIETRLTDFGVLGPLEVRVGSELVEIAPLKQRAVLALLVLRAGAPVGLDHLVERVWDGRPPATAEAVVRNAVSSLRKALRGAPGVELATFGRCYVLRTDPAHLEAARFSQLRERGQRMLAAGRADEAAALLDEALDLWRGPPLVDLAEAGTSWPEIAALEEQRLRTLEDRIEADLARGRHRPVVAALERLVREHPGRETLHRQHVAALWADGRQAHALAAYGHARAALHDRLDREPGRELRELHQAILEQRADTPPVAVARGGREPVVEPRPRVSVGGHSPARGVQGVAEVRGAAVLCLRVDAPAAAPAQLDGVLAAVRRRIAILGGRTLQTLGSSSLVLFTAAAGEEPDCERAVLAALAARELVRRTPGTDLTAAVDCGKVLLRSGQRTARAGVVGQVLDDCGRLLDATPRGAVHVSEATRLATREVIISATTASPASWAAAPPFPRDDPALATLEAEAFVGRGLELGLMSALLHRVRDQRRPHLLTVLGTAGIGKTRLIREALRRQHDTVTTLWLGPDTPEGRFRQTPAAGALRGLTAAGTPDPAARDAWRGLLAEAGPDRATVVVADDLHHADDRLLDLVEQLCGLAGPAPLLVIAAARPELLTRRPAWPAPSHGDTATLTLPPLTTTDAALLCGPQAVEGLAPAATATR